MNTEITYKKMLPYHNSHSQNYMLMKKHISDAKKKYGIYVIKNQGRFVKNKICKKCKKLKLVKEFYWSGTVNCYFSICKECESFRGKIKSKKIRKDWSVKERIKTLKCIDKNLKCIRCGCNDIRFLEINHKNGISHEERKESKHIGKAIVKGWRKTSDLEILCRPCNHIHYLEMKFGFVPLKVVWEKRLPAPEGFELS